MALGLVIGATGVAANSVAEHDELDGLISQVLEAQSAIAYSDHRVAATVDYTLPLLFSWRTPARVRAGLQQLVQDEAAGQVADIALERDHARRQPVLPWHLALRRAKTTLVIYLEARVAYLHSVATNQHTLYVEHPELDRMLVTARDAFRRAAGPGQQSRVDAAFAGGTHPA